MFIGGGEVRAVPQAQIHIFFISISVNTAYVVVESLE